MLHDRPSFLLTATFVTIGLGFFASTAYTERGSLDVDREVALMEANSLPSVQHLAAARGALRRLEVAVEQFVAAEGDRGAERERVHAAQTLFDDEIQGELDTPDYPGEKELSDAARGAIGAFERGIALRVDGAPPKDGRAQLDVHAAADRVDDAITRWMAVNDVGGRAGIARIKTLRASSVRLAFTLDVLCAAFALFAAVIALRSLRRQRDTEAAHTLLVNERAGELEMFAKRVAHDLLSPLSSLAFVLSSIRRALARSEPVEELLFRADASLRRSRRLVEGALDFARSVATPAAAKSDLREVIDGVVEETRAAQEEGVVVEIEPFAPTVVLCSAGVLTSILSNLVQNAVKYTEERPTRKVTLRASPLASAKVRVEVEDTGPGLPPGFETKIFEPYVRAPDAKPGLGLGLATVRRFVEAHGGRVGVDSVPDRGCTFWFELPAMRADAAGEEPRQA